MSVDVSLHPLVLLNISDHFTRKVAECNQIERVYGILIGTVSGRNIEIRNSFEALFNPSPEGIALDLDFILEKLELVKEIFKDFEFLGWYSTGKLTEDDMRIHRSIDALSDNSLYLVVNTVEPPSNEEALPVEIYESIMSMQENSPVHEFRTLEFHIETNDAERISVDQASKTGEMAGSSEYIENLKVFEGGIKLFKTRIARLLALMENNPEIRENPRFMRRLNDICNRIPVFPDPALESEFNREMGEELLACYMSLLTKSVGIVGQLSEKMEVFATQMG